MKVRGQPCIRELATSYYGAYQVTLKFYGSCRWLLQIIQNALLGFSIAVYTCTYKDIKTVPEIILSLFYQKCLRNSVAHDLTNFRTNNASL